MSDNFNITPEMVENIVNIFQSNINQNSSPTDSVESVEEANIPNSFGNIDMDTIFKIKTIIDSLNQKDDKESNLLYSLKPYLRKSRQEKIDQYINILKISRISNLFKNEKDGDD